MIRHTRGPVEDRGGSLEAVSTPAQWSRDGAEPGDLSFIAEMLSLSGGERFPPLDLNPQRKKERTLAALLRQLQALARRQPVMMIFEDLHVALGIV